MPIDIHHWAAGGFPRCFETGARPLGTCPGSIRSVKIRVAQITGFEPFHNSCSGGSVSGQLPIAPHR